MKYYVKETFKKELSDQEIRKIINQKLYNIYSLESLQEREFSKEQSL